MIFHFVDLVIIEIATC